MEVRKQNNVPIWLLSNKHVGTRRAALLEGERLIQGHKVPRPYMNSLKGEWGYLLPLDSTHEVDEIEAGKEAQAVAPIIYFANDADVISKAC